MKRKLAFLGAILLAAFIFTYEGNTYQTHALDEEDQAWIEEARGALQNIVEDREVMALVYLCDDLTIRAEAAEVIQGLRELGISKLVMMTGDNEKTARAVAEAVGVDAYYAEVLPEDKAAFVRAEHAAGRKVIMLGDGVNDSPALSEADAGVAISDGAAIAREVADITVSADDLYALLTLKCLSDALMERIHSNYRKIISFNFLLICLGVAGVLPPATSALLHNGSTLGISLRNMTDLLDENKS